MSMLLGMVVGPLAAPECRRALGRGWVILVRTLGACAALGVTLTVVWWSWILQQSGDSRSPFTVLRVGLTIVEGMLLTGAIVLTPAVMAGSLAGEKERGTLALLLATSVTPWEIVVGRLVGKLSQVGMILLAACPALFLLTAFAGFDLGSTLMLLVLPAAVAIGSGGMAALASSASRRGRDALLAVYLAEILLFLASQASGLSGPSWLAGVIRTLNPFEAIVPTVWIESRAEAGLTALLWTMLGLISTGIAAWRLRPSCLAAATGDLPRRAGRRRFFVPPVPDQRPMVWKELFIERVGTLGRFGSLVGAFLVLGLLGASLVCSTIILAGRWGFFENASLVENTREEFTSAVLAGSFLLIWLIQWAIGLRASVSISSERERGSWISLLTSPLEPGEIVRAKLWGSLYALRWMLFAAFTTWLLALLCGVIDEWNIVTWGAELLCVGAFMAAIGVRTSLICESATRAMAITLGVWLGAGVVIQVATFLLVLTGLLLCNLGWVLAAQAGLVPAPTGFWFPFSWGMASTIVRDVLYLVATLIVVADTRLRFDRIAGRMTEGRIAVAFDQFLHGRPEVPVLAKMAGDPEDLP